MYAFNVTSFKSNQEAVGELSLGEFMSERGGSEVELEGVEFGSVRDEEELRKDLVYREPTYQVHNQSDLVI